MFGFTSGFDFNNEFFKFGMIFGILGTATIMIGVIMLFTLQTLELYFIAEKQLQFS